MNPAFLATTLFLLPMTASAADQPTAMEIPQAASVNPEAVDISGLEEDYWRPNKDELEVVQNRKFDKKGRWELALHYGIFQGQDYVNSKSIGLSLTYNFNNQFFAELSHHKINSTDNDFLHSVQNRFGFTPEFNRESNQTVLSTGWTPIYAKFSLLGKKISHFETYFAPGIGVTKTAKNHLSGHFTVGQKFFLTERTILRMEWRMTRFTDTVSTTQGASSLANGGPGYVNQVEITHNIIFGLGVLF